jgi:cellobiose-specific phosphotransferase system component IIA
VKQRTGELTMAEDNGGADWYVYTGESKDAIAIAKNGVGPNGGWVGITVATMGVPNKQKTRQEINDWASLIVRSVNAHQQLVEALEEARDYVADALHEQQTKARDRAAYPTIGARELMRAKAIEDSMAKIDSALASAKGTTP